MKFGVLTFSYRGFSTFAKRYKSIGNISVNIGDYMQTLAIRRMYERFQIEKSDIVDVDRDSITSYDGEEVAVILNGCFFGRSFPLPPQIRPVFVGFQCKEPVVSENVDYFRQHEPIGCRDEVTLGFFRKYGVEAYVTGCLTMTLDSRAADVKPGKVVLVYGSGAGRFPAEVLAGIPKGYLKRLEFVSQRRVFYNHPLSIEDMAEAERFAAYLLNYYRENASLVVTPLHHAATPSMASGIPVVICRGKESERFSYLKDLLPIYLPESFSGIDWKPAALDMSAHRDRLIEQARVAINRAVGTDLAKRRAA